MRIKHAAVVLAFAGLSVSASGQALSVHLSFDATDAVIGEIVTATVVASFRGIRRARTCHR